MRVLLSFRILFLFLAHSRTEKIKTKNKHQRLTLSAEYDTRESVSDIHFAGSALADNLAARGKYIPTIARHPINEIHSSRYSIWSTFGFAERTRILSLVVCLSRLQEHVTGNGCVFLVILLHYFLLTNFFWMLVEGEIESS